MSADEIIEIIEVLPEYLKLFYPGYITIYVYYFCRAITIKDNKTIILKSIVVSYIYKILTDKIFLLDFLSTRRNQFIENLLLIILALVIAYLSFRLTKSKRLNEILKRMGIRTTFSLNELEEIENQSKNGTWLALYIKHDNLMYEGFLINKEMESDRRQYVILNKYRKYITKNDEKSETYIEDFTENPDEKVLIYLDNIKYFEIRKS